MDDDSPGVNAEPKREAPPPPPRSASPVAEKKTVPAPKKPALPTKNKNLEEVDGVGAGALAAAGDHAAADVDAASTWAPSTPAPFAFLADVFESVADDTKRLVIAHKLTTAFRAVIRTTPADLLPAVCLCVNRVAPAHAGVELGVGDATLVRALAEATGRTEARVKAELATEGDLGKVAAAARATQRTMFKMAPLTIAGVHAAFRAIALTAGAGSAEKKRGLIKKLLAAAGEREAGYIVRGLQGKLRIGLAEQTVLTALAAAVELETGGAALDGGALANRLERAAAAVKRAYSQCPSYDELVPALLDVGCARVGERVTFTPGVPVKPMLAKPTAGVGEVLDRAAGGLIVAEYKYDGERAQVHVLPAIEEQDGGGASSSPSSSLSRVRIYSRNSENTTGKYPDVAAAVLAALAPGVTSLVLDCEVVAVDAATRAQIQPFQILSTRKRGDVALDKITVPVCLFPFDCLYKNGEPLLDAPLSERRAAMRASLVETPGRVQLAIGADCADVDAMAAFLDEAVAAGTEGLIVKALNSTYEPSRRSLHWLKLKKDYLDGVGDTFDVVVIGAWKGRGKRTGVYGAFLLAVYDDDKEEYQSISKIGTGFSEVQLAEAEAALAPHEIAGPRPYYAFPDSLAPDAWFAPHLVWEVKAADLSVSPAHKAAFGCIEAGKGISIRFPRLLRVRDDKRPEDATSADQVADMYKRQTLAQKAGGGKDGDDDFY